MYRRNFLKTTVIAVGGTWWLGCGDGGAVPDPFGGLAVTEDEVLYPQSVASGDPRESSVVLWTRVQAQGETAVPLRLQVALDEKFRRLVEVGGGPITALSQHDHCVRVRLDGLEADTTYYYRFGVERDAEVRVSRTGRTRTAPRPNADVSVRFAVASCQDRQGRYYHAYRHMAQQELAFVVHLGDYIYEGLGEAGFQQTEGPRIDTFADAEGALKLGEGDGASEAARSLDNYRQLYRLVRGDSDLQAVHERFAMIAIWDDHEFSNDCYGQTANYFDGRVDERDPERRANADQAWFEYMPVDYAEPDFRYDRQAATFPEDLTIYRDFRFGRHLHLVMTDLRRYRSDHLIPEGAFPGRVAAEQAELVAALGEVPSWAEAYVDLDDSSYQGYRDYLDGVALGLGFEPGDFSGLVGVAFLNQQLQRAEAPSKPEALMAPEDALRGLTYARCFKTERYSSVGSRLLVRASALDALSRVRWSQSKGGDEQAFGEAQEAWFLQTLRDSEATWKVWGNEYTCMPRELDLSDVAVAGLLGLQDVWILGADDWEGMPSRRRHLLEAVGDVENFVAVTGDVHAFFVGAVRPEPGSEQGLLEFVAGSITSQPLKESVRGVAARISELAAPLAEDIEARLAASNGHLAFQSLTRNGYGVCELDAGELRVGLWSAAGEAALQSELSESLEEAFTVDEFLVQAGDKRVKRRRGGALEVWDESQAVWVGA